MANNNDNPGLLSMPSNNVIMKNEIAILLITLLFFGCKTTKDINNLSSDKSCLYPIGENDKWGYANTDGEKIIQPKYESVDFFYQGIALVKKNGKYGYLNKDGSWRLKPKYDTATSFFSNYALVTIKRDTFYIDKKGRKMKKNKCYPGDAGGCEFIAPANPDDYFILKDGKYEFMYKYYIKDDTAKYTESIDTSNLRIDEVIEFGNENILLKKDNKYGLFEIYKNTRIIINGNKHLNNKESARKEVAKMITFKYDDVMFERFMGNAVTYAKVKIKNKYGVINSSGYQNIKIEFDSLTIRYGTNMALVEYEPNKFGYISFDGKEFFKRTMKDR